MPAELMTSPYLRTGHRLAEPAGMGERSNETPTAFFAFDQEIVGRPSASGLYLLPHLEADLEAPDLIFHGGTASARPLSFLIERDRIIVYLYGSGESLRSVLQQFRTATPPSLRQMIPLLHASTAIAEGAPAPAVALEPEPLTPVRLPSDAVVSQIASRITELTKLSDGDLACLFPRQVQRETFQRWRTGRLENPTPANRRRMGILVNLFEDLSERGVNVREWVRNNSEFDGLSPYELLVQGRLDEVETLAARAAPQPASVETVGADGLPVEVDGTRPSFALRSQEPDDDLVFEDEDDWIEIESDVERADE